MSSGKRKITDQCTELSTEETPLPIKKPTLSKKSVSQGKKRSFQKLDEDSTSNRKACETFWTSSTEEWSRNLCSARTSAWRELQQETWSKSLKDLGSRSWFTVKVKAITAESMMTSPDSLYYLSQAITENDQQKRNQAEDKKLRQEENARVTKRQKQEERNASIPLEWNQEDYDRLQELTL